MRLVPDCVAVRAAMAVREAEQRTGEQAHASRSETVTNQTETPPVQMEFIGIFLGILNSSENAVQSQTVVRPENCRVLYAGSSTTQRTPKYFSYLEPRRHPCPTPVSPSHRTVKTQSHITYPGFATLLYATPLSSSLLQRTVSTEVSEDGGRFCFRDCGRGRYAQRR